MKFGLMAQGLDEATTLKERIERAWDNLPPQLVDFLGLKVVTRNTKEFALNNDSKIYIATSFRSGTLQGLHISEMGKISNKYPEKAKETKSGSMQAIRGGLPVIIESTAEGRANMFYDMWQTATRHEGPLAPKDFMPVFLSWVDDPDCKIRVPQLVPKEAEEYFDELEYEYKKWSGKQARLTDEQKWWWVAQLREFDGDRGLMGQEYPGWPEEAFSATKDGTYWARSYRENVVKRGHLVEDLWEPNLPVDVAMDLGMNDTMCLAFFQLFRGELRVIDEYHNNGEGLAHYVNKMREKPYTIRAVYVPHDAMVKELGTGKSRYRILQELRVPVRLLPRTKSVHDDIELVRQAIPKMWFDKRNTTYLQLAMENYTKEWDDRLGVFKDKPRHDCFVADTKINTPSGYKSIATIKEGDLVYGDGEIVVVEQLHTTYTDELLEVTLENGSVIYCTPTHEWVDENKRKDKIWNISKVKTIGWWSKVWANVKWIVKSLL